MVPILSFLLKLLRLLLPRTYPQQLSKRKQFETWPEAVAAEPHDF